METLSRVAGEEVATFCKPFMDKINYQERQTTSICPIFDHGWCSLPKIGQSLNLSVLVCYKIFDQIHLYFMIFFQSFITMVHDDSVVHDQSHPLGCLETFLSSFIYWCHVDTFELLSFSSALKAGSIGTLLFIPLMSLGRERETFPKAQRTQGIEYFDSFNTSSPKQKLQQALKSRCNFSLVCLAKGDRKMHTTLTNPRSNSNKSM